MIGTFIGWFVAKVGIPSFVVSLGLFLGFQGLMLVLLGDAGTYQIQTPEVAAIMNKSMPPWAGWLMLAVIVAGLAGHRALRPQAAVGARACPSGR